MLARLRRGADPAGWWMHYVVLPRAGERTLIGTCGYKGPPKGGTVEIGYGIVAEFQRQGFATEAADGLVAHAFSRPEIRRVVPETLPELTASIGVLRKLGFAPVGEGSEPGVVRYELRREDWEALRP